MSAWKDFVTASLLGTEKSGAAAPLPAALGDVLGPAENLSPEARFLTRAGAFALWRQAGWKPVRSEVTVHPPAPSEDLPTISPTSIAHLRAMLAGHCAEVLPEWLGAVARSGKRVPPEWLPALLDRTRQHRAERPLAMAAGGARIRWLAGLNPAWNFAADDSPEHWETGGREQRVAILRGWRATDPALSREKLASAWNAEPADARTALLATWEDGLTDADAEFLERALDDRSKEVRLRAAELLARLPNSAFAARMISRAQGLLIHHRGGLLSRASLQVHLPPDPDSAAARDGLDPKAFGTQNRLGDKAVLLILILAAVPLRHWTEAFRQSPAELLPALKKSEFGAAVATGWALAAHNQRDAAWAEALLDSPVPPDAVLLTGRSLFKLLPEAARANRLVAELRGGALSSLGNDYMAWQQLASRFASFADLFPESLARELLEALRRSVAGGDKRHWRVSGARPWLLKVPPSLLPNALDGWPADEPGIDEITALLTFRRDALAALTQP